MGNKKRKYCQFKQGDEGVDAPNDNFNKYNVDI